MKLYPTTPTEKNDGVMRHYLDESYDFEGDLVLPYDPLPVKSEVPLYAVQVNILRGFDIKQPLVHAHPEWKYLFSCLDDDRKALKFIHLALTKIHEMASKAEETAKYMQEVEIDPNSAHIARELASISALRSGDVKALKYLSANQKTYIPNVVPPMGADNYERLLLDMASANHIAVFNHPEAAVKGDG
jgi:hypothetical protein